MWVNYYSGFVKRYWRRSCSSEIGDWWCFFFVGDFCIIFVVGDDFFLVGRVKFVISFGELVGYWFVV